MTQHLPRRNRWPKGTYMRLKSGKVLKALMASKHVSYRDMAYAIGKSKGFISHLTAEREMSCKPATAEAIARRLEIPVDVLFDVKPPTASGLVAARRRAA